MTKTARGATLSFVAVLATAGPPGPVHEAIEANARPPPGAGAGGLWRVEADRSAGDHG